MKTFVSIIALGIAIPTFAADAPKPEPKLSASEQIALHSIQQEFADAQKAQQQAIKDLQAVQADIARENPGYHLDLQTLQLAKDTKK